LRGGANPGLRREYPISTENRPGIASRDARGAGYEVGAWFAEYLEVRSNSQKTLLLGTGERNLGPCWALCRQARRTDL